LYEGGYLPIYKSNIHYESLHLVLSPILPFFTTPNPLANMYLTTLLPLLMTLTSTSALPHNTSTPKNPCYFPPHLIALEEHTISPSLEPELLESSIAIDLPKIIPLLQDRPAVRLAAMDSAHISLTVLSQSSGVGANNATACHLANIAMSSLVAANPSRYAGFAVVPMSDPIAATAELRYAVKELGLRGAMVWNHLPNGTYYDDEAYAPFWAAAESLGAPIYIHPVSPTPDVSKLLFAGNYAASTAGKLGMNAWGWHIDVGTHVLRLFASGLFSRFPKLKIIIGHSGEGLAIFIDRIDSQNLGQEKANGTTFESVWKSNIWVTTSAFFTVRQFEMLRQVMPLERIMFSVDWPFSTFAQGWQFVQKLAEARVLTEREMDGFAFGNAVGLLGLKV
jgi:predicted TIM-barrel fold metal-dependent hydrolase